MTRPHSFTEALCHEVVLHDLFFGKFILSISRFVKMFTDPRGLIFLALGCVLLFAADPNNVRATMGPGPALIIWAGSVALYVATLFFIISLFSLTQHHFGRYPIYTPITSSLAILFVFICARAVIAAASGTVPPDNAVSLFFNLMGAGIVIETLFVRFVMPAIFVEGGTPKGELALIKIGDRQLPIARISHMTAQEHYVNVAGPTETFLIRARLGDAVAQTTPGQGMQPHRSWWVSAAAKPKMIKRDNKSVLLLADDTVVPIAKARLPDVQQWIDLYGDW